jgi:hypothetical protein
MKANQPISQEQKLVPVTPGPVSVAVSPEKFDYEEFRRLYGPLRPEKGIPLRKRPPSGPENRPLK